jgi:hypothetical protein
MKWVQSLLSAIWVVIRILVRDGWAAIGVLWRELVALVRAACSRVRRPGREGRVTEQQCVPIREPAFKQPDPMIYSQGYLMAQGLAVTWDNPDIVLQLNGAVVPSSFLLPDTEYDVVARIWNNSTEAPVVGMLVIFSYVSFGVGAAQHPIGKTSINLGVKGGPNHPALASVKWRTPAAAGHYCIQVLLDWFDDVNPNNNLGQENTIVGAAHSPAEFVFALRNATRERQAFRYEVDTYRIPDSPPCPAERPIVNDHNTPRGPAATRRPVPAGHDRRQYPVPEGWAVEFDPPGPLLAPGEEINVRARIMPTPGFTGRKPFNVNVFHGDGLAGGVTLIVEAS